MRIHTCSFCGFKVYPGHGTMFIRNDSKVFRFCSKKCRVHFRNKRNPRKTRWTAYYHQSKGKALVSDSTFEFEKRRNKPVKYDRELMATTLKAMKEIARIQAQRKIDLYDQRFKKSDKMRKKYIEKVVLKDKDLIVAPVAKQKNAEFERIVKKVRENLEKENLLKNSKKKMEKKESNSNKMETN